nr:basic salivary proline-rich protein 4-like [Aegilops tauschii subsp. strangulata]
MHRHQGRRPGIQDLDTTAPETGLYPNQRDEQKRIRLCTPGPPPASRPNRSANTGIHRPILQPRARDEIGPAAPWGRDEVSPAAPCARRARSCCTGRETSDGPQMGKGQPFEGSSAERRGDGEKAETVRLQTNQRRRSRPPPQADPPSHHGAAKPPWSRHDTGSPPPPDLHTSPPTAGTTATPGRCPTRVAWRAHSAGAAGHAPPPPRTAGRRPPPDPAGSSRGLTTRHLPSRERRSRPAMHETPGHRHAATSRPLREPAAELLNPAKSSAAEPEEAAPHRRPTSRGEKGPAAVAPTGLCPTELASDGGGEGRTEGPRLQQAVKLGIYKHGLPLLQEVM